MISIEKLERSLKSLNMTMIVLKILSLVWEVILIFGFYGIRQALANGVYDKLDLTSQQLEAIHRTASPLVLAAYIILFLLHILIVVLLFKNHKAIANKEYVSYLPYYLCLIPFAISIALQIFTGLAWAVDLVYLAQMVILAFAITKARQLNENG